MTVETLAGVRAIVAGGASGIGRQIVQRFAASGASVTIFDQDHQLARESADAATEASGRAVTVTPVDVTDLDAVAGAMDAVADTGRLTTVVNCVGVNRFQTVDAVTKDDWDSLIAVNLTGAWNIASSAIPHLRAAGGGSIVLLSSVAGILGIPKAAPYTSAKHGVIGLVRALAIDLGPENIRVNAVCPGVIATPLLERATTESFKRQAKERTPLRRLGRPDDVAQAVAFLVSDSAEWITGASIPVDGGLTCGIRSTHWE